MVLAVVAAVPAAALGEALGGTWAVHLVVAEVVCFALPTLLVARVTTGSAAAALGLDTAPARALVGAALVGGSFWYLNAAFVAPWSSGFESSSDRAIARAVTGDDPAVLKLVLLALVPAMCEELLVRGAIARALAARRGALVAVLVSSAYFALLHLSLARAAPTALLGALLAVLVLRSGSLWPAILAHALNNGIAVVLVEAGEDAALVVFLDGHPGLALSGALVALGAGLALLWRPLVSDATSLR